MDTFFFFLTEEFTLFDMLSYAVVDEEWRAANMIGNLSKPQRQRQRERRQTKGLMSKTIAVHVRYKSLYISLPFSAKQQREMTEFRVFWRDVTKQSNEITSNE